MHYWIPFICQKKLWKTLKWAKILLGILCSGPFWIFCTLQSFRYFTSPSCKKTGSNVKRFSPSDPFSLGKYNVLSRRIYLNGPYIPCSYAMLFFMASDFTFTTRHIHNWELFLLWPSCFILSGAISSCPPLFPSSILDTFQPGGSPSGVTSFCLSWQEYWSWFSWQEYWSGLPFPSSNGPHFVRTLHYDLSVLDGPAQHGSWLDWIMQAPSSWQSCDPWRGIILSISPYKETEFLILQIC